MGIINIIKQLEISELCISGDMNSQEFFHDRLNAIRLKRKLAQNGLKYSTILF